MSEEVTFSHVTVGTRDFAAAKRFYDAVLPVLGLAHRFGIDGAWAAYGKGPRPTFHVLLPFNGEPALAGNGVHVAFWAATRAQVDSFHAAALAHGGSDEGGPGLRPHYHANYYGAYVRDPDGNKLQAVCHIPA
jgi:catechol 2,3-dioxygenase-like lactoylglutathione lyase family enzyme